MRIPSKFNTVFYRVIISFASLTLLVTIILGLTSYLYFSSNFNKEIEKVHLNMLEHINNVIKISVFEKIQNECMSLLQVREADSDITYFASYPIEGNHKILYNNYKTLYRVVAENSDLIHSVLIYYPNREMILSYPSGVKYLNENCNQAYRELDWYVNINQIQSSPKWIEPRKYPDIVGNNSSNLNLASLVWLYPSAAANDEHRSYIVFNIKEDAISNIIRNVYSDGYENTFIINSDGQVLVHNDKNMLYQDLETKEYIKRIIPGGSGSFVCNVDGLMTAVTFATMENTEWILVNTTLVNEFYENSAAIQQVLFAICVFSVLVGWMVSAAFSFRIYNPLKVLINNMKALFSDTKPNALHRKYGHEYEYINDVVSILSFEVKNLSKTMELNKPLIKHTLVVNLLNNSDLLKEELDDRMNLLLGVSLKLPWYAAIMLDMDLDAINQLTVENRHLIKYHLISYIEGLSDEHMLFLAADLSLSRIGVVVNYQHEDETYLIRMVQQTIEYIYESFMIGVTVCMGTRVEDPLQLNSSYNECLSLIKYRFFLPENRILIWSDLAYRENSKESVPDSYLSAFSKALHVNHADMLQTSLREFASQLQNGTYSADHCHQKLYQLLRILSVYMKEMKFSAPGEAEYDVYESFRLIQHIGRFEEWVLTVTANLFTFLAKRNNDKNTDIITNVKKYILDHIHEDISLITISDHVNLSSGYFSKLFKEETGTTFVDFITHQRIEKAKDMLLNTNLSIIQVSKQIGYNSPAYFIRKFKEHCGETPNNFKKK